MAYQKSSTPSALYVFVSIGIFATVIGQAHSQEATGSNQTIFDSAPTVNVSAGDNSTVVNSTTIVEEPDSIDNVLVVRSRTGQPCLLAALNATIQVSYAVLEGIVHERYVSTEDIQLPEDVKAQGVCGQNQSQLLLAWGNGTFHINLTFTLREPSSANENSTWAMTAIFVSYDLANEEVFPGSSEATLVTAERSDLSLFTTELGHTYSCQRDIKVQIGTEDRGVKVKFHNVELAAFGVTSPDFPSVTRVCPEEDDSDDSENVLVPLIVACCLSAIVIIIVIGYVISRRVQKSREQSDYRAM